MPHSSGGGSSSGGSHSGSSSSGGSSSSKSFSRSIYSDRPHSGYSRYGYYQRGQLKYRYLKDSPSDLGTIISEALILVPLLILGIIYLLFSVEKVQALPTLYDTTIIIEDNANILTSTDIDKMTTVFKNFQDKTGITPAFVTDYNDVWEEDYVDLSDYAYDLYLDKFDDESHWLIIYTQTRTSDSDSIEWYWEGMQGNNTDYILTSEITNQFTTTFQKHLEEDYLSIPASFILSFDEIAAEIQIGKYSVDTELLMYGIIFGGFAIIAGSLCIYSYRKSYKKRQQQLETAKAKCIKIEPGFHEDVCEYCGGVYLHGKHIKCPHCNAPIKPLNTNNIQYRT